MTTLPELLPLLKHWRLSGILDSLEARTREALDRHLAYTDFLGLLLAGRSGPPRAEKTGPAPAPAPTSAVRKPWNASISTACPPSIGPGPRPGHRPLPRREGAVLIVGPCGTGKSISLKRLAISSPARVTTCCSPPRPTCSPACARPRPSDLRAPLSNPGHRATPHHRRFRPQAAAPARGRNLPRSDGERYERAATVLTSNLDFGEWGEAFPPTNCWGPPPSIGSDMAPIASSSTAIVIGVQNRCPPRRATPLRKAEKLLMLEARSNP